MHRLFAAATGGDQSEPTVPVLLERLTTGSNEVDRVRGARHLRRLLEADQNNLRAFGGDGVAIVLDVLHGERDKPDLVEEVVAVLAAFVAPPEGEQFDESFVQNALTVLEGGEHADKGSLGLVPLSPVVALLAENHVHVRHGALRVLNAIASYPTVTSRLLASLSQDPNAVPYLVETLRDPRDVVYTETLQVLIALTHQPGELGVQLAFQGVFERVTQILCRDDMGDPSPEAALCLQLVVNLVRDNDKVQRYFQEIGNMSTLLRVVLMPRESWSELCTRARPTAQLCLRVLAELVSVHMSSAPAVQGMVRRAGVESLVSVFDAPDSAPLVPQLLLCLSRVVARHADNRAAFRTLLCGPARNRAVLMFAAERCVNAADVRHANALDSLFFGYLDANSSAQVEIALSMNPNPHALPDSGGPPVGCFITQCLLNPSDTSEQQLLRLLMCSRMFHRVVEGCCEAIEVVCSFRVSENSSELLLHALVFSVLKLLDIEERTLVVDALHMSLLRLLATWLAYSTRAVQLLLSKQTLLFKLVDAVTAKTASPVVQGCGALVLGLCLMQTREGPKELRGHSTTIANIIMQRITAEVFSGCWEGVRKMPEYASLLRASSSGGGLVLQRSEAQLDDLELLDAAFVQLFETTKGKVEKTIWALYAGGSAESVGEEEALEQQQDIRPYKELLRRNGMELEAAQKELEQARARITQLESEAQQREQQVRAVSQLEKEKAALEQKLSQARVDLAKSNEEKRALFDQIHAKSDQEELQSEQLNELRELNEMLKTQMQGLAHTHQMLEDDNRALRERLEAGDGAAHSPAPLGPAPQFPAQSAFDLLPAPGEDNSELEDLRITVADLNERYAASEERREELEQSLERLMKEMESERQHLQLRTNELEDQLSRAHNAESDSDLREEVTRLQAQLAELQEVGAQPTELFNQLAVLKSEQDDTAKRAHAAEDERDHLAHALQQATQERDKLDGEVTNLERKRDELQTQLGVSEATIASLQGQLQRLQEAFHEEQEAAAPASQAGAGQGQGHGNNADALVRQLRAAERVAKRKEEDYDTLHREMQRKIGLYDQASAKQEEKIAALQGEKKELARQIKSLGSAAEQVRRAQEDCETMRREMQRKTQLFTTQMSQLDDQVSQLQADKKALETQVRELARAKQQVAQLESDKEAIARESKRKAGLWEQANADLRDRVSQLQTALAQAHHAHAHVQPHDGDARQPDTNGVVPQQQQQPPQQRPPQQPQQAVEGAQSDGEDEQVVLEQLLQELQERRAQDEPIRQQMQDLANRLRFAEEERDQFKQSAEEVVNVLAEMEENSQQVQEGLQQSREHIDSLERERAALLQEKRALTDQVATLQRKASANTPAAPQQDNAQELVAEVARLKAEVSEQREESAAKDSKLAALMQANDALRERAEGLHEDVAQARRDCANAEATRSDAQQQLAEVLEEAGRLRDANEAKALGRDRARAVEEELARLLDERRGLEDTHRLEVAKLNAELERLGEQLEGVQERAQVAMDQMERQHRSECEQLKKKKEAVEAALERERQAAARQAELPGRGVKPDAGAGAGAEQPDNHQADAAAVQARLQELQSQSVVLQERVHQLEQDKREAEERLAAVQSEQGAAAGGADQAAALAKSLEAMRKVNSELTDKLGKLRLENKTLQQQQRTAGGGGSGIPRSLLCTRIAQAEESVRAFERRTSALLQQRAQAQ